MSDSSQVLEVLREARGLADAHWGTTNLDVPFGHGDGWMCASIAISTVARGCSMSEISVEAHAAFLRGAGLTVPESDTRIVEAVYAFNDAQPSKVPVIAAFDTAILEVAA